ncbi:MAG TPA: hypothetical protein VN612_02855 [Acidobacteriaceae bacterium]|nr:hypothetical protein [Acidobacteriaceae bacterium]
MHPPLVLSVVALVAGTIAAQSQTATKAQSGAPLMADREAILGEIKVCEDARRKAEAGHAAPATLAKMDVLAGSLYEDIRAYPEAEALLQHAVKELRGAPPAELGNALGELAALHIAMDEHGKAEKESRESLALFEQAGDVKGVAMAHVDLANAEIDNRHFAQAVDDAQKAMTVLADDPATDIVERIAVRQTLGFALGGAGRCSEAMPVLKNAMEIAGTAYGQDSLAVGVEKYLMGRTAWNCGDMVDADAWMGKGIARMKVDLGWGHMVYLSAVSQYAKFLRERGQKEEAAAEEREIRMANAVVDARTISTAPVNGLR